MIRHGHGKDSDQTVGLSITLRDGKVAITSEDTAPSYTMLSAAGAPDESAMVEERPVGGPGEVHRTFLRPGQESPVA